MNTPDTAIPEDAKDYYGTKRITAWPEDRPHADASDAHTEAGYGVLYPDGYRSWSPKEAFEAAYRPITAMDFSGALAALRDGHKIQRRGWPEGIGLVVRNGSPVMEAPHNSKLAGYPEWDDMLATDWMIVV